MRGGGEAPSAIEELFIGLGNCRASRGGSGGSNSGYLLWEFSIEGIG